MVCLKLLAGEAKVGLIYKDELGERRLRAGDVYRIPAGSAFYLVNTGEGQRLHIICSVDTSESLGMGTLQVHMSISLHDTHKFLLLCILIIIFRSCPLFIYR